MKKILLVLSLFIGVDLAFAAGDPVPGVGVSLEQIPGGVYHTQRDCTKIGGSIIHKNGKTYCTSKRIVANTETGQDDTGLKPKRSTTVKEILKDGSDGLYYQRNKKISDAGRHKRIVASTETSQDRGNKYTKNKNEKKHNGLSLERIPGNTYHTQNDCKQRGGTIIQIEGVAYCGPDVRIINDGGTIVISSSTFIKTDCPKNTNNRHNALKSYTNYAPKKSRKRVVKFKAGSELASKSKGGDQITLYQQDGRLAIDIKHSPSRFSTASRGTFKIAVKNKGNKLGKGMLSVVDHMPAGLSVKTGGFRANSWRCKGGMISSSGQDVTCTYNRKLGKKSRATLNLNVAVASAGSFPADVKEVENCATASVKESSGMAINRSNSHIKGDVKVEKGAKSRGMAMRDCDKVKIRHAKSSGSFNLPISIGIGMGGFGGGSSHSKQSGVAR